MGNRTRRNKVKAVELGDVAKSTSPIGLGDVVAKITAAIGIEPCESCLERKAKLNKAYSFLKAVLRELTDEEIAYVEEIRAKRVVQDTQKFTKLFNQVFGTNQQSCDCPSLYKDLLNKLEMQIEYQKIK